MAAVMALIFTRAGSHTNDLYVSTTPPASTGREGFKGFRMYLRTLKSFQNISRWCHAPETTCLAWVGTGDKQSRACTSPAPGPAMKRFTRRICAVG